MGYILPIPHYQYSDYRERVERTKRDPFPIEPVFKLDLEQQLDNPEPREEDRKDYQFYNEQITKQHKPDLYAPGSVHLGKTHKVYSDLTGIGRHFNESI
ncbi:hypothetical protein N780_03145 [Pontibacillus chungwhensis BH030062]|uniref:Uncharacterized protein n=1 Tax=Pontibacillus chungwhensis BH030062 TaxID=1385513 RepID=A0A0A2UVA0_9BACI|nr:hypothetical protein [Pontibacillus chungwhensis]KGP90693.1 hypothetical protein N780_03145 [Pontibacillus chungwhensis BH030062]